jgi:formamidase
VKGAQRGDVLEVKILDVTTQTFGFTTITPGFGLLRECFPRPFVIKWEIDTCKNVAASPRLPGIQIPGAPFMGVMGTAPSHALMQRIASREKELLQRGGFVLTPSAKEAVPANEPIASEALRTIPPRENGGNLDVKQLTAGTTLLLPVFVPGALFSAGDGHCAQGDAESCGTAVETGTTLTLELNVREGKAGEGRIYGPQYERNHSRALPRPMPERYHATTGISVTADGRNESENVTLAARNAVLSMIDYLVSEHGLGREQAYALASVAVDLRISTIVGVPNVVVSAFLPLDIFC